MNDAAPNTTPDNTIPSQDEDLEASLVQLASRLFPKDEVQKNMRHMEEMEARVSELEARLAMTEEAKSVALKEREVADEARKKLEKTLAELLSKFASVRENHAALLRDAEQARAGYDTYKLQMQEAERAALAARESETAARESEALARDEANAARESESKLRAENEDLRDKLESQFLNLEVLQTQLRSEQAERENLREEIKKIKAYANGEIKPALAENDRFSREMVTHVEDIVEQLRALREDVAQRCNQMENVANYLGGQLTETHDKLSRRLNPQQPEAQQQDLEEIPPAALALDSKPNLQAQPA